MRAAFSVPGNTHPPSLSQPGDSEAHLLSVGVALSDPISRIGTRSNKFPLIVSFLQKFSKLSLILYELSQPNSSHIMCKTAVPFFSLKGTSFKFNYLTIRVSSNGSTEGNLGITLA